MKRLRRMLPCDTLTVLVLWPFICSRSRDSGVQQYWLRSADRCALWGIEIPVFFPLTFNSTTWPSLLVFGFPCFLLYILWFNLHHRWAAVFFLFHFVLCFLRYFVLRLRCANDSFGSFEWFGIFRSSCVSARAICDCEMGKLIKHQWARLIVLTAGAGIIFLINFLLIQ